MLALTACINVGGDRESRLTALERGAATPGGTSTPWAGTAAVARAGVRGGGRAGGGAGARVGWG